MLGIGEQLRNAREQKNISIDDVAQHTNLKKDYILALENEDFASLPTFIHAKGFLKTYAQFLGLEAPQLTKELAKLETSIRDDKEKKPVQVNLHVQRKITWDEFKREFANYLLSNQKRVGTMLLGTVAIVLSYYALMLVWHQGQEWWRQHSQAKMEEAKNNKAVADEDASHESFSEVGSPSSSGERFSGAKLTLKLEPKQAVRVSVTTDDFLVYEGVLSARSGETWSADQSIDLKLSKPSAVGVSVNGQYLEELTSSESSVVHITKKGVEFK